MRIRRFVLASSIMVVGVAAVPTVGSAHVIVAGSTWYSDGSRAKSGPVGTTIRAYATNTVEGVPYKLVLGLDDEIHRGRCATTVQEVNPNVVYAGHSGLLGRVTGSVAASTPVGTYFLCFKDSSTGEFTNTGGATFTVE
jgi:hypothetical protein